MPLEENAPPELIEQHRAIVLAETEARASRGAKNRKKSLSDMIDVNREHETEADFASSLHHNTMVTSYSTVSLRDIDPTSIPAGAHQLLHAAPSAEQPSTPTTVHPRPRVEEGSLRVSDHDPQKHEYSVPPEMTRTVLDMGRGSISDMVRPQVADMGRSSVHDMGRSSVPEMSHSSVSDMGRASVPNDDMGRGAQHIGRPVSEISRSVQDMGRNVPDMSRGVQEMRMKVSEFSRSIEVGRNEMPRSISDLSRSVQEMTRRNVHEMQRNSEIGSNVMVPSSHAERSNIMTSTSHSDRPNIMVPTSHAERGSLTEHVSYILNLLCVLLLLS